MNDKQNFSVDLIIILGATATGKTRLAVKIAGALNGEIISADSRQVYRKLDIGTGKDYDDYFIAGKTIPYHLIDILDPEENYSVYQFQKDFKTVFEKITKKGKQPILCGGTGLYIESVLLDYPLSGFPPDFQLREELESKNISELLELAGIEFNENTNESERNNKRRIIRFIEKSVYNPKSAVQHIKIDSVFVLGIDLPRDIIRRKISDRLNYRLKNGLIEEVEQLVQQGLVFERLDYFGLEYRFIAKFLQGQISRTELQEKLGTAIHQFAKRQLSWFRRMERRGIKIHWIPNGDFEIAIKTIYDNTVLTEEKP